MNTSKDKTEKSRTAGTTEAPKRESKDVTTSELARPASLCKMNHKEIKKQKTNDRMYGRLRRDIGSQVNCR